MNEGLLGRAPRGLSAMFCVMLVCACGSKGEGTSSTGSSKSQATAPSSSARTAASASKPPTGSSEDLPADKALSSTIDGKDQKFVSAVLTASAMSSTGPDGSPVYDSTLTLKISEDPAMDCDHATKGSETLSVEIDPGPDNGYFAGHVIAAQLTIYTKLAPKMSNTRLGTAYSRVKVFPFTLSDDTVKVALDYDGPLGYGKDTVPLKGSGFIEAKLCKGHSNFKPLTELPKPAAPGESPVRGKVGSKDFESKTALAYLVKDEKSGLDEIALIALYDAADATCEMGVKSPFDGGGVPGRRFEIQSLGLTEKRQVTGSPQPVRIAGYDFSNSGGFKESGVRFGAPTPHAYVVLDKAEAKEGGTVSGKLFAETGKPVKGEEESHGSLSGTFTAKVCRRSWAH